jgi:hypothetical protein
MIEDLVSRNNLHRVAVGFSQKKEPLDSGKRSDFFGTDASVELRKRANYIFCQP